MKVLLAALVSFGTLLGAGATVDVPFELGRPAREWCLRGVDLALPGLPANPGTLGFGEAWELHSSFSSLFGLVQVWGLSLQGRGLSATGTLVNGGIVGPNLAYRVWAWKLGMGVQLGALGLGGQAKLLCPEQPKAAWGGALDVGAFWAGPPSLGVLVASLISSSPYPGEPWPPDVSLAAAWPWESPGFSGAAGAAVLNLLTGPSGAVAVEVNFGPVALRAGVEGATLSLGGGVGLRGSTLDWAFTLHPDLPLSFRVSFALRWS